MFYAFLVAIMEVLDVYCTCIAMTHSYGVLSVDYPLSMSLNININEVGCFFRYFSPLHGFEMV